MSIRLQRLPAHQKYVTDLEKGTGYNETCCNWSSSQEGQMLAIYLDRPACEHDSWNVYGGTRVGNKTALCKAGYIRLPAGVWLDYKKSVSVKSGQSAAWFGSAHEKSDAHKCRDRFVSRDT